MWSWAQAQQEFYVPLRHLKGFPQHPLNNVESAPSQSPTGQGLTCFQEKESWCPTLKAFGSDCKWTSGLWEWEVGGCQSKEGQKTCWVKDWGEDDGNSTGPSVTLRMSLANHTFCSTLASRLINFNWLGMTCPPDLEVECSTPTSSW